MNYTAYFTFSIFNISLFSCLAQTQFQLAIGGTGLDDASIIIQTTDGGYIVAGGTNSFGAGQYDIYTVKLSGSGTLQWRTLSGQAVRMLIL